MISGTYHNLPRATEKNYLAGPRKPGILIADDMGLILTLLKFELEPRGFTVWLAVDGDDALDLYRQNHEEIDLVLLDVQMTSLDGPRTLAALQRLDPDVLACFMTRNSDVYTEEDLLDRGAVYVFKKPFQAYVVAECLRDIVTCSVSTKLLKEMTHEQVAAAGWIYAD